ncbi:hypothetical protein J1605_015206 [Eschrichtius robustus]|uniref:Mitochondrial import receptor subunit TOM22 homolog n=1 Tax=Eschrichtius robustus TaxID=9764 RepID=A0AB34GBZ0_ESCRO|nr:hypothetical protein J1605_015206 [Eschrichtius robustus]
MTEIPDTSPSYLTTNQSEERQTLNHCATREAPGAPGTFDLSLFVAQKTYRFSRAALWIGTTSLMILVLPVVFEKLQLQQRQILLGPNSRLSGGMPGALPSLPGKI